MGPTTYLHIPGTDIFRRRAASMSESKDRYISSGGLVDITELTKQYEAEKFANASQKSSLFGSISPRTHSSRGSSMVDESGSPSPFSLPLSPYRSEGWVTPDTPRTPATPLKQSFLSPTYQNQTATSPITKHNRCGLDLNLTLSPGVINAHENLAQNLKDEITPTQRSQFGELIELPGSLLLPSQGFPQSNPPVLPPRHHLPDRSHSAPSYTCPKESSNFLGDSFIMSKTAHVHQDLSIVADASSSTQYVPPPRLSSLPDHSLKPSQHLPPPVPLSRMKMEELMQVLPTLNAAIIAHDWIPCMQKRHQELKTWLQNHKIDTQAVEQMGLLDKVR